MPPVNAPRDLEALFYELNSADDRTAILIGTAYLEYALERAIEARLRTPTTEAESSRLFNDREGIIGTLSEKIWAAFFLKIVGPTVRRDLDLIRRIRNIAAHDPNYASFDATPEITSRCGSLELARDATVDPAINTNMKRRFLVTVQFFAANLLMRSGDESAEIHLAFKGLAPSLDK